MSRLLRPFCLTLVCLLALTACKQDAKNYWKDTKHLYREYVNTPATLDTDEEFLNTSVELKLAQLLQGMDEQIVLLHRILESKNSTVDVQWIESTMQRLPWLSGIAELSLDGTVLSQYPEISLKPLHFEPLANKEKVKNFRALRGYIEQTPMGAELYLASPIIDGEHVTGFIAAHFDVRALLAYCPKAEELAVIAASDVLWHGGYDYANTPLASVHWESALRNEVQGEVSDNTGSFYWIARYIGDVPFVYASTTDSYPLNAQAKTELEEWLNARSDMSYSSTEVGSDGVDSLEFPAY